MKTEGELQRLRDRLRVLSETTTAFADATTDYPRLIDTISRRLTDAIGDTCAVFFLSDDGKALLPMSVLGSNRDAADQARSFLASAPLVLADHPAARQVVETGEPFVIRKLEAGAMRAHTSGTYADFIEKVNNHSLLVVPLRQNGRSIGILTLSRHQPTSPPFDDGDVELVQMLASHAALAIANARTYIEVQSAHNAAESAEAETRRLRAEQADEARFRGLVEAAPDGIVIVDEAGRITIVNARTEELFGYSRAELIGMTVDALVPQRCRGVHPGHRQEYSSKRKRRAMRSGLDLFAVRKDGTEFPVEISLAPIDGPDGSLVSAAIRDVSDRKRSDEQRYRLAAIVESSDDAIIGKTLDGIVTSWNGAAERLFGYGADEMIGKSIATLLPPGNEAEETRILARLRAGENDHFDTVRRRKDGQFVDVSVTSSPIADASGRLIGASKVARDITARKRAEEDLARAKETAESVSRELESFSYSVAHDLRAPLRGMNGFAQMLIDDYANDLDAEGKEWLQEILTSARRMGELIDALLSLSRLTRSTLQRETVDLSAIVHATEERLSKIEPDRKVDWVVQDDLRAQIDPALARGLMDNLLGNAWKFTANAPSARIEFGMTSTEHGPAFFVRDNGAGFDMAYASKLFAPFQRLHTIHEFPGTGIGLASVQRIVHRHGGRIWAEGTVNGGADFYFTLPSGLKETGA